MPKSLFFAIGALAVFLDLRECNAFAPTCREVVGWLGTQRPPCCHGLSPASHHGDSAPTPESVDNKFGPLLQSVLDFNKGGPDEAARVFHGRGGLFPGYEHLTLDWFPPVWLLTSYNQELSEEEVETITDAIAEKHSDDDDSGLFNFVYQFRSPTESTTHVMAGEIPNPHIISENGMKFIIRLDRAKNHGIFLDMENGRDWIRKNSLNKKVLNLFAYTCGFSVAALFGGADIVVNMDMVDGVLKVGQKNHELNDLKGARFLAHDIFKSWGKIRKLGKYDIIVADPPSFQKGSFIAKKDYGKVIRRLPELLSSGGVVILCLNAPELDTSWLQDIVAEQAPNLAFAKRLENPKSFTSADTERGLKVLVYTLPDRADS